jgi:hypothetical protein
MSRLFLPRNIEGATAGGRRAPHPSMAEDGLRLVEALGTARGLRELYLGYALLVRPTSRPAPSEPGGAQLTDTRPTDKRARPAPN